MHVFLISTEVPFIQEVSGAYILTKNGFAAPKGFRGCRETGPGRKGNKMSPILCQPDVTT